MYRRLFFIFALTMLGLMAMAFVLNRVWEFAFGPGGGATATRAPSAEEVAIAKRVEERRAAEEARRERLRRHRESGAKSGRQSEPLGSDQFDPRTGRVAWTERLARDEFQVPRVEFEQLLKELGTQPDNDEIRIALRGIVDNLQLQLDDQIQDLPTMEFMESHRFLRRLRDSVRPSRGTSN